MWVWWDAQRELGGDETEWKKWSQNGKKLICVMPSAKKKSPVMQKIMVPLWVVENFLGLPAETSLVLWVFPVLYHLDVLCGAVPENVMMFFS